jgi:hypothetical protein
MAMKLEYLYNPVPHGLSLKHFFDRHAFNVRGANAMQMSNQFPQFRDVFTLLHLEIIYAYASSDSY